MTATKMHRAASPEAAKWAGPTRRYDLLKEFVIACGVVAVIVVALAVVLGSPDDRAVSIRQWSHVTPNDFVLTAATELDGTSPTATYGAPYSYTSDAGQKLGPLPLADWGGVRQPVDTTNDFVVNPLRTIVGDAALTSALQTWTRAPDSVRQGWASAYDKALSAAPDNNPARVKPGNYGPVPVMLNRLLGMARSGGLDGALTSSSGFYAFNYTKPLLLLSDGSYLSGLATAQHLAGDQWGMMNETGNFPGQAWLWLYTFWYQISPFNSSGNADALVWGLMALLTLGFILVPFIPGIRSIPRLIPIHRLIWRDWYSEHPDRPAGPPTGPPTEPRPRADMSA
ncbi:MAG TPA: hypothetical protein VFN68_02140 [Acidimicrobiales bacterium]|nr:hypothetical protein [Acidimicrobiales bacterium]